jgi:hypothetical protein
VKGEARDSAICIDRLVPDAGLNEDERDEPKTCARQQKGAR